MCAIATTLEVVARPVRYVGPDTTKRPLFPPSTPQGSSELLFPWSRQLFDLIVIRTGDRKRFVDGSITARGKGDTGARQSHRKHPLTYGVTYMMRGRGGLHYGRLNGDAIGNAY